MYPGILLPHRGPGPPPRLGPSVEVPFETLTQCEGWDRQKVPHSGKGARVKVEVPVTGDQFTGFCSIVCESELRDWTLYPDFDQTRSCPSGGGTVRLTSQHGYSTREHPGPLRT